LARGVAVDGSGNAWVVGTTNSANFPTKTPLQSSLGGGNDVFLARLNPAASGAASLVDSTFLGGAGDDFGWDVALDRAGNPYVTGSTSSSNFPTLHPLQPVLAGHSNAFVAKLSANGQSLIYSTFLGGRGSDTAFRVAVDNSGQAYVTGSTSSSNFPTVN